MSSPDDACSLFGEQVARRDESELTVEGKKGGALEWLLRVSVRGGVWVLGNADGRGDRQQQTNAGGIAARCVVQSERLQQYPAKSPPKRERINVEDCSGRERLSGERIRDQGGGGAHYAHRH